ncbi:hypothetical protein MUK42_16758 [Musa troglodytarum]|uniref:Uncharacterized protein n=1 Tax=Musa troglodytarum TaxID=320322 RepID=A0A9E7HD02_9LILI|nr:hypothetical protein MUK42_16758 [Musa troglodytarum]
MEGRKDTLVIGSKVDREKSIRCRGGPRPSQHFWVPPAVGLRRASCHLEGCGGPWMETGSPGQPSAATCAAHSPIIAAQYDSKPKFLRFYCSFCRFLLSVRCLLLPSAPGVVGGSALQSRAEVPTLEGCLSLLLRVWDSTTPCSLGGGNANPVE